MKNLLLESAIVKAEALGVGLVSVLAIISPDKELSTIGWALLGSVIGGFLFTALSKPLSFKDWTIRWMCNIAAGFIVGLVTAAYYTDKWSTIPLSYFTMLCSFFAGPIVVLSIPIMLPIIGGGLKRFFTKIVDKFTK